MRLEQELCQSENNSLISGLGENRDADRGDGNCQLWTAGSGFGQRVCTVMQPCPRFFRESHRTCARSSLLTRTCSRYRRPEAVSIATMWGESPRSSGPKRPVRPRHSLRSASSLLNAPSCAAAPFWPCAEGAGVPEPAPAAPGPALAAEIPEATAELARAASEPLSASAAEPLAEPEPLAGAGAGEPLRAKLSMRTRASCAHFPLGCCVRNWR